MRSLVILCYSFFPFLFAFYFSLSAVVANNDVASWSQLLALPKCLLSVVWHPVAPKLQRRSDQNKIKAESILRFRTNFQQFCDGKSVCLVGQGWRLTTNYLRM